MGGRVLSHCYTFCGHRSLPVFGGGRGSHSGGFMKKIKKNFQDFILGGGVGA